VSELEFHQARLLVSSMRREIRKMKEAVEKDRMNQLPERIVRLGYLRETLQWLISNSPLTAE